MIILFLGLLSLCALYITHLLSKMKMRWAAISVASLYFYLVAWTYSIFILDIADLGFAETETRLSMLHGSDVYHSFVKLNGLMSTMPLPLLETIASVTAMTLVACIIVVFHGVFEIAREIIRFVKRKRFFGTVKITKELIKPAAGRYVTRSFCLLYCRANC